MKPQRVLLAGATGAVGLELLQQLKAQGHFVRTLSRDPKRASAVRNVADEVVLGDATRAETLASAMEGIDVVASCLGANVSLSLRERRGFWSVDVPANSNLITAARTADVKRFVYLSLHVADAYAHTRYTTAHEAVVERLRASGMTYSIVRPTGIFNALDAMMSMASWGLGSVVGNGTARTNPIHPADVARAMGEVLSEGPTDLNIGGPDVLTRREVLTTAFEVLGKRPRAMRVPAFMMKMNGTLLRPFHPRLADMLQFAAIVTTTDCIAPAYGQRTLRAYYEALATSRKLLPARV